jgi:hypothetical protein
MTTRGPSIRGNQRVIVHLALQVLGQARDREINPPWSGAGPYWQDAMRTFARPTVWMFTDGP